MDEKYIKAHEDDDIFKLINELTQNVALCEKNITESVCLPNLSTADRTALKEFSERYNERIDWCRESINKIIEFLIEKAYVPTEKRAYPGESLKELLAPKVQPADWPHFTEEMIDFLDQYFWLVPKLEDGWLPSLEEM